MALAYPAVEAARSINNSYRQFFLPFWWGHILKRGILDADTKRDKTVDSFLRSAPAPLPTPLPAYVPPAAAPPAAFPPFPCQ